MANMKVDTRRDILLLLLYAKGRSAEFNEPIIGRTRLVKMLYLFKEEALPSFKKDTKITEETFYQFFPWHFGPFSAQVYDDITFFSLRGYLEINFPVDEVLPEAADEWDKWQSEAGAEEKGGSEYTEYREEEFQLTAKGKLFAKGLFSSLGDNQRNILNEFKRRIGAAPLRAILRYVYSKYPDMTERSTIKGQVLGSK